MLESTLRDLRYALRQIAHIPVITGVSVALIAFGIAGNAAFLSFLDVVILQPMPGVSDAQGLVRLYPYQVTARQSEGFRLGELLELRDQQRSLVDVGAAISGNSLAVDADGITKLVSVRYVTGGYFTVMRLPMALGSTFRSTDDRSPGTPESIAIVSYRFWQSTLGGDSAVIGRTLRLNRVPFQVIGVLPEMFRGGENDIPVWLPFASRPLVVPPGSSGAASSSLFIGRVIGRLRPDVDRDRATAAISAIAAGWGTTFREKPLARVVVYPDGWLGPDDKGEFAQVAAMMGLLSVLVLLIACANVSVLLLGRAVARRRELALRLALGAARPRVVRQLLTENILTAVIASIASILFLHWANGVVLSNFPDIPFDLAPTWRTALATMVVAGGAGVVFGILPALNATDASIHEALKAGGVGGDPKRASLQRRFVIAEVAMSTALICATGLLINEIRKEFLSRTPDPLASDNVLAADIPMGTLRYPVSRVERTIEEIRGQILAQPGVLAVSAAARARFDLVPARDSSSRPTTNVGAQVVEFRTNQTLVTPVATQFFAARGGALIAGREFGPEDRAGAQPVVIVDSAFAEKQWPGRNPLGQILHLQRIVGRQPVRVDLTVVGVTPTRKRPGRPQGIDQTRDAFVPWAQMPDSTSVTIYVRTTGPAAGRSQAVQAIIRAADPDLPISDISTTLARATRTRTEMLQVAAAVSSFGAITLFMACVGVYAVIAFGVAQRTREIGIRIAVGANPTQVVNHFFRGGLRLALFGTLIGVPSCLALMRYGFSNAFPRSIFQPFAIAVITVIVLAVVAVASWIPARAAARVQPMDALRAD